MSEICASQQFKKILDSVKQTFKQVLEIAKSRWLRLRVLEINKFCKYMNSIVIINSNKHSE